MAIGLKILRLREQGYTDVIVINLSSGISGSYPSATQAGEMVEDIQVHTFDSRLAAMIEGSFAIYAAQLVQKGYKPDDIINELTEIRQHIGAYLIVDDLKIYKKVVVSLELKLGRYIIENETCLAF